MGRVAESAELASPLKEQRVDCEAQESPLRGQQGGLMSWPMSVSAALSEHTCLCVLVQLNERICAETFRSEAPALQCSVQLLGV